MKHVDIEEMVTAAVEVPVKAKMTRAEKLNRWADLVRQYPSSLRLFSNLEHWTAESLVVPIANTGPYCEVSALSLAGKDAAFQAEGLPQMPSARDIMNYFELSQADLHEFSCDCGGYLSNARQADRIAGLARTGS